MNVLQRYISAQVVGAVLFVLIAFLSLFAFFDLMQELPTVGRNGYQLQHAFMYVALGLPDDVYLIMPIAALIDQVRQGGRAAYNILRYNAGLSRLLPGDWQMRFNLSGQYTRDALIPGEQFGAGGAGSVRGFAERDLSNDYGYLLNAEVYTPNFCTGIQRLPTQCRAVLFYDAANVSRNNPLPGEQAQGSIGSIGLGLRLAIDKYMSLQLDYGQVVDAGVTQNKSDRKLHFRLVLSY